jgi:poly(A)-specific ribonuclease
MEVTRHNFAEHLPTILSQIADCDFLSIDTELTGLGTQGLYHYFDTQSERYTKIHNNVLQYQIIQFGLSLFCSTELGIKSMSYTFFVFDRNRSRNLCINSASMKFLLSNQFDFNKLVRDGISWLNWEEEKTMMNSLQNKFDPIKSSVNISAETSSLLKSVKSAYRTFWNDSSQATYQFEPQNPEVNSLIINAINEEHEFKITLRKQSGLFVSNQMYEDLLVTEQNDRVTLNRFTSPHKDQTSSNTLIDVIGFSYVIQQISRCGKPLIGHNIMLDLVHIIDQFIMPLPREYERFRGWLIDLFPKVYDTKQMTRVLLVDFAEKGKLFVLFGLFIHSNLFRFDFHADRTLSLEQVYAFLKKENPEMIESWETNCYFRAKGDDISKFHVAGYDSFVAGLCFLGLRQLYDGKKVRSSIWTDSRLRNCIYNPHSYDIPFLSPENDLQIVRKNVFYFRFHRKMYDLHGFFSKLENPVVSKLSDNQVLVAVCENETKNLFKLYQTCDQYRVCRYSEYENMKRSQEKRDVKRLIQFQDEVSNVKSNVQNIVQPDRIMSLYREVKINRKAKRFQNDIEGCDLLGPLKLSRSEKNAMRKANKKEKVQKEMKQVTEVKQTKELERIETKELEEMELPTIQANTGSLWTNKWYVFT